MTLADELERAWRTMEAGNSAKGLQRSLADFGVPNSRMILAIEEGCREILFPAEDTFTLGSFPRTRGVKVSLRTHQSEGPTQRYLVLRCATRDYHAVFRRFAGAVLEQVAASTDAATEAAIAIRAWHEMFDRAGNKGDVALLGLFGELHELLQLAKLDANSVRTWTGPRARPQDFTNGTLALEVKTSRTLASEVEIHGLEQLWATPYESLVLVVKQVVVDPGGSRLRDLVDQVLACGASAEALYESLEGFDLDATQLGALDLPRFTYRGSRYFLVGEDAPAITPERLQGPMPTGVSRLRYVAQLDHPGLRPMTADAVAHFLSELAR